MGEITAIEFRFEHDKKTLVHAMKACGRSLAFSRGRWISIAFSIFLGILIFLGSTALAMLIFRAIGLWELKEFVQFIVLFGLFVSYFVWKYYRERVATYLVKSPLFLGETIIVASEDQITITNPMMNWKLKWGAVDTMLSFRSGLGLRLGNIVVPIPERAIPSEIGLTLCKSQMDAWRKAAQ